LLGAWLLIMGLALGVFALTLTRPSETGARILFLVLAAVLMLGALVLFRTGVSWAQDAKGVSGETPI
jgi:hypothetical protein